MEQNLLIIHRMLICLVKNWEACLIYLSGNKQVEKPLEENLIKINFAEREVMLYVTIMSM